MGCGLRIADIRGWPDGFCIEMHPADIGIPVIWKLVIFPSILTSEFSFRFVFVSHVLSALAGERAERAGR